MESVKVVSKTAPMRYRNTNTIEDDEQEIAELESTRNGDVSEDENLEPEESTFKKRYGDLRRHSQSTQQQHAAEKAKLQEQIDALTTKQVRLPKSDEELEAWTKKYPDVAKIVETIATKKATESRAELDKKFKDVEDMRYKVQIEEAENQLKQLHPDYDKLRKSTEFHAWVDVQPKWIRDALYDNDLDFAGAAKAIDLYKMEVNPSSKNFSREAAQEISSNSRRHEPLTSGQEVWSESKVKALTGRAYEKYADAIDDSIRQGVFVYDMTGGAR
tara:strand:+ start:2208 stop:3026 length:819 start_codon:yes stop_codon:yes gene_type:complete